nr:hypothetical protein [Flavobacteriales bacterium]
MSAEGIARYAGSVGGEGGIAVGTAFPEGGGFNATARFAACDATRLKGAWSKLRTLQPCVIARYAGSVGGEGGI